MNGQLIKLIYEIELQPGEKLNLPESILNNIAAGNWVITIQQKAEVTESIRTHDAFLNGYAPEDEGLYDDYLSR
ncbi:hypothetical protein H6G76_31870 [Nostoc sp. FACHB-152]|uniref:hypothetical protein n=1 Tax=unclassified Nostoc TaxID=2593658 RepID=UPI0016890B33|nr:MULTISPECIES: hypothetical protein [unclassified Nostoc]MBD2451638.1 hypothetical protein [Nostoc sp. FACHB-152]MBD2472702.1 hypothetical protein [Nostoc sp. FACHB-145]